MSLQDLQLQDLACTLARRQRELGYLAIVAIGHRGAGRTVAPYEASVLLSPTTDISAALKRAWDTDVREMAAAYVVRHGLDRGVVGVRISVARAGSELPGDQLAVHVSDVGVRQVSESRKDVRRPFSLVQGSRP